LAKISELLRKPNLSGKVNRTELAIHDTRYSQLKGYEELAHNCYGRTVTGNDLDEDGERSKQFTYRITQANIGHIDDGCFVLARNSPIASMLVTTQPGDEAEVNAPGGLRSLTIDEVRLFEGPVSLRSANQKPNFRAMALQRVGVKKPIVLENLRAIVFGIKESAGTSAIESPLSGIALPRQTTLHDPSWLDSWQGIYLGNSDEQSLGHQFFTRTTPDQERALNKPKGLTLVEGIAGAGKTSVALGRLKFFANFSTGEELDHYGLQNSPANDFAPLGMVGFVLSHSLKRYLKETAAALDLERLPIRDFEEYRTDLCNQFGLTEKFKRRKADPPVLRTQLLWLRALDAAIARAAGANLRDAVAKSSGVSSVLASAVKKISDELVRAAPVAKSKIFHMHGLAARIAATVADIEFRQRDDALLERAELRRDKVLLDQVRRRLQQESERRPVSPLLRKLLSVSLPRESFSVAVQAEDFTDLVMQALAGTADKSASREIQEAVGTLRQLLAEVDGEGRGTLTDSDLTALVAISAINADGFEFQRAAKDGLYQIRHHTAVFIDEVQDFTETEVLLMGMAAVGTYHQITLSGDRCQRLQPGGAETYQELFPFVPARSHNRDVFLDHNFRQREELSFLSAGFRSILQGDERVVFSEHEPREAAPVYAFRAQQSMADFVLRRLRVIPPNATVAVILPDPAGAQIWYDLLQDELETYYRPALLSRRDDLTKRLNVHFTDVRETKGLEFDIIIVPDLGAFPLETELGRNQAYVAISRAKHALILGCREQRCGSSEIELLEKHRLIRISKILTQ
jgi:transcription elongation GreA/GreB family factor